MKSEVHSKLLKTVEEYNMPAKARALVIASELVIVCGVTAAGKNTILDYLIDHDNFVNMVSHTTRSARENHGNLEKNGEDYWFVSEPKMLELIEQGAFVEVNQVHGTMFYGTSTKAVEQAVHSHKRPITEIDVQGAQELMAEMPELRPLFVLPPSYEVWMERFGKRGSVMAEEKERRLVSARTELQLAIDNPQFALIVNHEFHQTVAEIMNGVDLSPEAQAERRKLAQTLLDAIKI